MSQSTPKFQAAEIGDRFKKAYVKFDQLLASANSEDLTKIRYKLREGVKEYKQKGALTVAFIGQYSAGKSTIISALTGRRDIHIDADIATDKTSPYDWNGIRIIDTPGLFTDRQDHDQITYEAISKADLLVFCLTYMLFDTYTVENFKKLAYDKGYRWKMMLVINKMSADAGEEEGKIASYRHSFAEALKPYDLDEFPVCFIDAKDYCEGIDEDDEFLTEISRFNTFVLELNNFVKRRAVLANYDTPVRIVLSSIDEAQIGFARNSNEDIAFLEILSRFIRRINKNRERLRTKVRSVTLEMKTAVVNEGIKLASSVGGENFERLNEQSEINVRSYYENASQSLETAFNEAIQSIQSEIEDELKSNLTQEFIAQLNFDSTISVEAFSAGSTAEQIRGQIEWLQKIGDNVGVEIGKFIPESSGFFLKSSEVASSQIHTLVYDIGKFVGFKFKPWQAIGIAKNISNFAKFLGSLAAIASMGLELHAMYQEQEYEKKMADIRRNITSQFKSFSIDLEQQIENQLREFEAKVYGQLEQNIIAARKQNESAMAASNADLSQLADIRGEFESILKDVGEASLDML
ncbi:MAG: 50S ribosome-binding GTPase [Synechococcales cyanobacterium T60_A2020_003]|nr:50S ribosome-binding GTPase [Synechococcales cyanobacterium T60_A2020_003]